MNKGRVLKGIAGEYTICDFDTNDIVVCKQTGKLKLHDLYVKAGDIVLYDNDLKVIKEICERYNDLERPLIANIDQAFIIFSLKEPDLNLNLLDKFLITLEYYNIKPIIVFNKEDLVSSDESIYFDNIIKYYSSIGYTTIITCAKTKDIDSLKLLLKDKISVFTGQSGVGKSSLLNALDSKLNLETNEISKALGRGKHTTRSVELIPIFGGYVADTPGFGTIDFNGLEDVDIAHNMIEFFKASEHCKYNGCLHLNEPNCNVKKLVEEKIILSTRYENYVKFINDLRKKEKNDYSTINLKSKKRR